jgi:hypothetical protein
MASNLRSKNGARARSTSPARSPAAPTYPDPVTPSTVSSQSLIDAAVSSAVTATREHVLRDVRAALAAARPLDFRSPQVYPVHAPAPAFPAPVLPHSASPASVTPLSSQSSSALPSSLAPPAPTAPTPPTSGVDPKLVKAPDSFTGVELDRTLFLEWRSKIERYIRLTHPLGRSPDAVWNPTDVRDLLSLHLSGAAFTWLETSPVPFPSPSHVLDALATRFIEPASTYQTRLSRELEHRDASNKMKSSTTVAAYDQWFHTTLSRLGTHAPSPALQLQYYKDGVRPSLLAKAFALAEPTDLLDARIKLEQAERYDPPTRSGALPPPPAPASRRFPSSKPTKQWVAATRSALTSLAFDDDQITTMLTALHGPRTSAHVKAPAVAPHVPRAPITDQEREYLRANNGCYRCRQLGHMRAACPLQFQPRPASLPPANPTLGTPGPPIPLPSPVLPRAPAPRGTPSTPSVTAATVLAPAPPVDQADLATVPGHPSVDAFSDIGSSVSHQDLQDLAVTLAAYHAARKN